jgi:hypothetical protein
MRPDEDGLKLFDTSVATTKERIVRSIIAWLDFGSKKLKHRGRIRKNGMAFTLTLKFRLLLSFYIWTISKFIWNLNPSNMYGMILNFMQKRNLLWDDFI